MTVTTTLLDCDEDAKMGNKLALFFVTPKTNIEWNSFYVNLGKRDIVI